MTLHDEQVAALRSFNRAYTAKIGLLKSRLDGSPFTLSEARILYEIAHGVNVTAADIGRTLALDRAQISRTLKRFVERGLVVARNHPADARNLLLSLTDEGLSTFISLESNTREAIGGFLDTLLPLQRDRLIAAARSMTDILGVAKPEPASLRDLRPGDLGWIIHRQATLYAHEYGWNNDYEALVAKILSQFQEAFDPTKEAAWIAETDGRIVGSIFLVKGETPDVAKLRLLYVEPEARGTGLAKRMVETCIERAVACGYQRLDLWTNSVLVAARKLYERAGFRLTHEAPHHSFGRDLVGQTWSLELDGHSR